MLQEELIASGYNQVQTARRLGLSLHGLIKNLKRYGITAQTHAAPLVNNLCILQKASILLMSVKQSNEWALLGLNQRPLACEASALPLS
jgi:hypothetical protein